MLLLTYTPLPVIPQKIRTSADMLTFLHIPFDSRHSFWHNNEAELEYLYHDFVKESKKIKCRLHPDNGGDAESFVRFNKFCVMVVNSFRNHGIDRLDPITVLQIKQDQISRARAKASFKKTGGKH